MGWIEETHRIAKPVRAVAYNARTGRRDGTKSFATEREARDWITFREEQIANLYRDAGGEYHHRQQSAAQQQVPTLAEYARSRVPLVQEWSTLSTRRQRAKVINAEIRLYWGEKIRVNEVTKTHVREMLAAARDRGVGLSGRKDKLSTFRRIFEFAIDEELRGNNPTRGVTLPAVPKKQPRPLPDEEIAAIADEMPEWLRAAVWVSADAGLRIGEVCGLQREQVDPLHRRLWVKHVVDVDGSLRDFPKGGDVLAVPMTGRLYAELESHIENHYNPASGYLFTLPNGTRLQPRGMQLRFRQAYEKTGNRKSCPVWHDLRHNTANKLKDVGAPSYVIQARLRHKNISTSERYLDAVSDADQRQWANRAFDGQEYSGA